MNVILFIIIIFENCKMLNLALNFLNKQKRKRRKIKRFLIHLIINSKNENQVYSLAVCIR